MKFRSPLWRIVVHQVLPLLVCYLCLHRAVNDRKPRTLFVNVQTVIGSFAWVAGVFGVAAGAVLIDNFMSLERAKGKLEARAGCCGTPGYSVCGGESAHSVADAVQNFAETSCTRSARVPACYSARPYSLIPHGPAAPGSVSPVVVTAIVFAVLSFVYCFFTTIIGLGGLTAAGSDCSSVTLQPRETCDHYKGGLRYIGVESLIGLFCSLIIIIAASFAHSRLGRLRAQLAGTVAAAQLNDACCATRGFDGAIIRMSSAPPQMALVVPGAPPQVVGAYPVAGVAYGVPVYPGAGAYANPGSGVNAPPSYAGVAATQEQQQRLPLQYTMAQLPGPPGTIP